VRWSKSFDAPTAAGRATSDDANISRVLMELTDPQKIS
jgi:hypothetical protein